MNYDRSLDFLKEREEDRIISSQWLHETGTRIDRPNGRGSSNRFHREYR